MQPDPMREPMAVFFSRLARRVVGVRDVVPVVGGAAQGTWRATLDDGTVVFVKTGTSGDLARFKAEARGLAAIEHTGAIRVPQVFLTGGEGPRTFLVLEHFDLVPGDARGYARLGHAVAALHRAGAGDFGFERDNFIGPTPQENGPAPAWPEFFRDRRLVPQLRRVEAGAAAGMWLEGGYRLADAIAGFFPGYAPAPSLLHGDLWSGNAGFLADGTPVLYDPAVYYGDREADIAMSELFGGFAPQFRAAYREAWPLDPGYAVRRDLYNLYHVLNHVNLFGGGYVAQAQGLIRRLLAEIR